VEGLARVTIGCRECLGCEGTPALGPTRLVAGGAKWPSPTGSIGGVSGMFAPQGGSRERGGRDHGGERPHRGLRVHHERAQTGFPDDELALFATDGFDKDLGLGVISNKNYLIETPQEVAEGIKKATRHVAPERVHLTSDCGLFAYSRVAAKAKLKSLARGAAIARAEIAAVPA
jgi:cobalamin-independent methionine synthase catalytic subunit